MYRDRLKHIREEKEITQEIIAKYIGIHKGRYSQYETEHDIMPLKHLNVVCNYFDVSLDYLFGFVDVVKYENSFCDIDNKIVGERLKSFRKENKLTQVKLAEILNTVHPVITNYEKGKFLIATSFLYTICKKYGVSADYLLGKVDNPKYWDSKKER